MGGLLPTTLPPICDTFPAQLLSQNSKPAKSKVMMPRSYMVLSFSSSGKSQKETVISKVFIDVESTTTRQIPFINAPFVRKIMPEL